jgi:DNA polymerase-3 subunit alpha
MRHACKLIRQRHDVELNLDNIPTDDPVIYDLLSRGDVMGVFQVEGQGMRRVLMKMQPSKFDHVIATISLFRPGPMEYIDDYIDRMHGRKPVEYRHPSLEPILEETYAIIVYQEQIIRLLTDIAGYSAPEADLIRRAVGKKKKAELLKHRASFVEGAVEQGGLSHDAAEAIFSDIEYFARYGFNKAHAADYAVLTCQTAYLKATYPVEYMAALLSVERHNTEKIGLLIAECRRMGIEVLPPDVNVSGLDFTIEKQTDGATAIRFGMGAVKNVGEGPVETILAARQTKGVFRDLGDFCRRVDLRQVNRRALESLIKVGTLRPFGTRSQLLPIVERIVGLSASLHHARDVGQMSLFGEATGVHLTAEETLLPPLSQTPEVPQKEILAWEKDLVGVYISEHPLTQPLIRLQDVVTTHTGTLGEVMNGQSVVVAGMVQRVRRHITKKGDEMAFVTLEDLQGVCDLVVFPRTWEQTKPIWQPERVLVVGAKVDAGRRDEPSLLCNWVKTPDDVAVPSESSPPQARPSPPTDLRPTRQRSPPPSPRTVCVTLARGKGQTQDVQTLHKIHSLLVEYSGQDHFIIRVSGGPNGSVELAFPNNTTHYCPELTRKLTAIVGAGAVQVEQGVR